MARRCHCAITAPAAGATIAGQVTVGVSASDDKGIDRAQVLRSIRCPSPCSLLPRESTPGTRRPAPTARTRSKGCCPRRGGQHLPSVGIRHRGKFRGHHHRNYAPGRRRNTSAVIGVGIPATGSHAGGLGRAVHPQRRAFDRPARQRQGAVHRARTGRWRPRPLGHRRVQGASARAARRPRCASIRPAAPSPSAARPHRRADSLYKAAVDVARSAPKPHPRCPSAMRRSDVTAKAGVETPRGQLGHCQFRRRRGAADRLGGDHEVGGGGADTLLVALSI